MDQKLKFTQGMKAINLLVALVFMMANVSTTQASVVTYNVTGIFYEPMTQPSNTVFNGSFEWDGTSVSNLHGTMNSTMYDTSVFPLLDLDYQLAQSIAGNIVTTTVFKENTTDVFSGGGYEAGHILRYGNSDVFGAPADGNTPNDNAYFSFAFDKTSMTGILDEMVYGDCTPGGMMGQVCMTGHSIAKVGYPGTMDGNPLSLEISAVPVPAAVWLFGTALVGMIGVSRKRDLQA